MDTLIMDTFFFLVTQWPQRKFVFINTSFGKLAKSQKSFQKTLKPGNTNASMMGSEFSFVKFRARIQ